MSTQSAFASYDEIIDLHTESDTVSVIGIHTPTSTTPHKMFKGFFEQFKKFKYLGCSLKLVPAARLPADPLQVSYEAGEPTIDPRDLMNPILFHGAHGNDLGQILNRLYTVGTDTDSINRMIAQFAVGNDPALEVSLDGQELEQLYYKALTDKTWKKAHPQRGFRKSGLHPMIYSLATTHQILGGGLIGSLPNQPQFDNVVQAINRDTWSGDASLDFSTTGQLITPRLQGLGWLDTKNTLLVDPQKYEDTWSGLTTEEMQSHVTEWLHGIENSTQSYATLPQIFMGVILLPPAYKTEQYYRMIVTHSFAFKGFRGISFSNDIVETPSYFNMNNEDYEYDDDPDKGEYTPPESLSGAYVVEISNPVSTLYQYAGDVPGYINLYNTLTILDSDGFFDADDNVFTFKNSLSTTVSGTTYSGVNVGLFSVDDKLYFGGLYQDDSTNHYANWSVWVSGSTGQYSQVRVQNGNLGTPGAAAPFNGVTGVELADYPSKFSSAALAMNWLRNNLISGQNGITITRKDFP